MPYHKVPLQLLPAWRAYGCFDVGPTGNPVGNAQEKGTDKWFVVTWGLDGSIISNVGPFDDIVYNGGLNAAGELVTSVLPKGASLTRPVLIRDDKVVRDFGDLFSNHAAVSAFNAAGVAVGAEAIGATTSTRPFVLDVRGSGSVRYLDAPPGTISARGAAINAAGDIVVNGNTASGQWRSIMYVGGVERRDLGAYGINDLNNNRLCAGFILKPHRRAGLLDASGTTPSWTEFPLPEGTARSEALFVNDKNQSVGMAWLDDPGAHIFVPFSVSGGVLKELSELVAGAYVVPQGLGEGGEIATGDGGRPVLLTPARAVRTDVDLGAPLWKLVLLGSTGEGPIFGVSGVTVQLPNGNIVNLPVIPIPNDPTPGPTWSGLNEGQRVALVASALAGVASRLQEEHARTVLTRAARDLLAQPHRG